MEIANVTSRQDSELLAKVPTYVRHRIRGKSGPVSIEGSGEGYAAIQRALEACGKWDVLVDLIASLSAAVHRRPPPRPVTLDIDRRELERLAEDPFYDEQDDERKDCDDQVSRGELGHHLREQPNAADEKALVDSPAD